MINDFAQSLITSPPFAVWLLIPLLAFLESCIGLGLFVSGVLLLTTSVLLYASGEVTLTTLVPLAFGGAIIGDHTGFWSGRLLGAGYWHERLGKNRKLASIEAFFQKSAPWAICIGRLTPALRSLTPLFAGTAGITPSRFLMYDLIACTVWVTGLCILVVSISQL